MVLFMVVMELIVFMQGTLQFRFVADYTGKTFRIRHCLIYLLCIELCGMIGNYYTGIFWFTSLLEVLALYGAARLLLKNEWFISVISAILTASITQFSYGLVNSLTYVMAARTGNSAPSYIYLLIGAASGLLSLFLSFCCYYFAARHFTLSKENAGTYFLLILFPVLLSGATGFYIINFVYGNSVSQSLPAGTGKGIDLILIQLLGFCTILSILFTYGKLCESISVKSRLAMLEQETNAQKAYVCEARTRYEKTRAFRHDIRNHLSVLGGLLNSGHSEQAADYLAKLGAAVGELAFTVHTGNPVIDVLLISKLDLADHLGIETDISLCLPKTCKADDMDLCVIFSNALDNAITACCRDSHDGSSEKKDTDKKIRITGEQQGDFYMLEFENTCPENNKAPVPGTGLSNIKTVAEKYNGAVMIEQDHGHFCLDVLLNLVNDSCDAESSGDNIS